MWQNGLNVERRYYNEPLLLILLHGHTGSRHPQPASQYPVVCISKRAVSNPLPLLSAKEAGIGCNLVPALLPQQCSYVLPLVGLDCKVGANLVPRPYSDTFPLRPQ